MKVHFTFITVSGPLFVCGLTGSICLLEVHQQTDNNGTYLELNRSIKGSIHKNKFKCLIRIFKISGCYLSTDMVDHC